MPFSEESFKIAENAIILVAGQGWKEVSMEERAELILSVLLINRLPEHFFQVTIDKLVEWARGSWDELDPEIRRVLAHAHIPVGEFSKNRIRRLACT